jgi:hypothetical protein
MVSLSIPVCSWTLLLDSCDTRRYSYGFQKLPTVFRWFFQVFLPMPGSSQGSRFYIALPVFYLPVAPFWVRHNIRHVYREIWDSVRKSIHCLRHSLKAGKTWKEIVTYTTLLFSHTYRMVHLFTAFGFHTPNTWIRTAAWPEEVEHQKKYGPERNIWSNAEFKTTQ